MERAKEKRGKRSKSGGSSWTERYLYILPAQHTLASLASLDASNTAALRQETTDGFVKLLRHLANESSQVVGSEPKITFKSNFLTPRFTFEQMGSLVGVQEDMVWVRGISGVYAIRKDQIAYQVQKN